MEIIFVIIISSTMPEIKEDILNQSLQLFLKFGIRNMSNEKLAKDLAISTKTLYKYFQNKEALLEEAALLFHQQQYEALNALSEEEPHAIQFYEIWKRAVDTEYHVNRSFFQELAYYYPKLAVKTEKEISQKLEAKLQSLIQQGIDRGQFRPDINIEVVLESMYLLYAGLVRSEKFKKFNLNAADANQNTIALFIRGICTINAIATLDKYLTSQKK